jgi:hypothetical protein
MRLCYVRLGQLFPYLPNQPGYAAGPPDRKHARRRLGNLAGVRQWTEAIIGTLKGQPGLERHGGRTPARVFTRIAQRLLAMAACIWHNWPATTTGQRSLTAHDHRTIGDH